MQLNDFLSLVKVLRMLFGVTVAKKFFLANINQYDKVINSDSLNNLK